MEDELRCPVCKQLFNNPVLLPCYHALCLICAVQLQQPVSHAGAAGVVVAAAATAAEPAESVASGSSSTEPGDYQEVDKLSILSETDSGVVCTSRPNSYVGTPNLQGLLFPPLSTSALSLPCPVCHKLVYFDENGAHNLPKYRVMQAIVDKYGETREALRCEMCEGEPAPATTACEQCAVLYCDACREACHPARGPLAKHTLHEPRRGLALAAARPGPGRCPDHEDEALSMYCLVCKQAVCALCLHDTRHTSHDVQAIAAMCKAQKVWTQLKTKIKRKVSAQSVSRGKTGGGPPTETPLTDLEEKVVFIISKEGVYGLEGPDGVSLESDVPCMDIHAPSTSAAADMTTARNSWVELAESSEVSDTELYGSDVSAANEELLTTPAQRTPKKTNKVSEAIGALMAQSESTNSHIVELSNDIKDVKNVLNSILDEYKNTNKFLERIACALETKK